MKKQSFTLLIAVLFFVQGIAQQVEQQQRSLLTKRTATWCPYCGTWGWNYFKGAIEQNNDKAVYVAAHYSGNLFVKVADDISNNLGGGYQPRFFLNDIDQNVSSGNVDAKLATLKTQIDDNFAKAPIANSGFEPVFSNGEIKVAAKVKFFQAAQGDFYLGIYLLEDNVTAYQASIGNNAVHRFLLRQSFTEDSFGQPITNGEVVENQEFDLFYSLPIDEIIGHDYEVMGVIWKKEGDKYLPMNVWTTNQIGTESVSNTSIKLPENRLTIAPNVAHDFAKIVIEQIENQPFASLEVLDINGRLVTTLHKGSLKQGYSFINFDTSILGNKGLYFIRLKTPGREITEKLIVQ